MSEALRSANGVTAVVVTHESAGVIDQCLDALRLAAPRRGLEIRVVDNASQDGSAERAATRLGEASVVRLSTNRGFAAGVNAVLGGFTGEWLALVNPDVVVPAGAIDALADVLVTSRDAGLVAPRVVGPDGRSEASVGRFPTLERERAHALFLDRLIGREGRLAPVPLQTASVDWVSGCMWLLRGVAVREIGPMDEDYFMYYEDVDYCRRLREAGWGVIVAPSIAVTHARGRGSVRSHSLPADGGRALLHYFLKFHRQVPEAVVKETLQRGWGIRYSLHSLMAMLGNQRSKRRVKQFRLALTSLDDASSLQQPSEGSSRQKSGLSN